jgi:hypothetical protein
MIEGTQIQPQQLGSTLRDATPTEIALTNTPHALVRVINFCAILHTKVLDV